MREATFSDKFVLYRIVASNRLNTKTCDDKRRINCRYLSNTENAFLLNIPELHVLTAALLHLGTKIDQKNLDLQVADGLVRQMKEMKLCRDCNRQKFN